MSKLIDRLARWLPLMMAVVVIVTLWQFLEKHPPSLDVVRTAVRAIDGFIATHWALFGVAALMAWMIVALAVMHYRKSLPRFLERTWIMDVLDRLTNRGILERKLSEESAPVAIDAGELARRLKARLIGQDPVCDDLAAQIRRRLALTQRGKPVGVFLFAGPPGTGKTFMAKRLAVELERKLIHLDMAQFSRGSSSATQLFGASRGYVGSDSYGKLTAALRDMPDSVVLLDEFEKAHTDVHKHFLTAWNDGFVTEASDGSHVSTTRAIFVLTTNAATDALSQLTGRYLDEPDELRRASAGALRDAGFAAEVISRIDRIFVFRVLAGLDVARVAALEIEDMIRDYGLEIAEGGIAPEVLLELIRRQERLGSAASSRELVRNLEETIADALIEARERGTKRVELVWEDGRVIARSVTGD